MAARLGAVVGGVGVPLFLQSMNVLTGDGPIAWGLVTDDAIWAMLFGGVAAAGSILLARRAERLPLGTRTDALERGDELDALPAAEQRERMVSLRTTVREFNVYRWAGRMLSDAGRFRQRQRVEARVMRHRNA